MAMNLDVKEEVTEEEHEVPDIAEMCFVDVNCLAYSQYKDHEDASDPLQFEEGLKQNPMSPQTAQKEQSTMLKPSDINQPKTRLWPIIKTGKQSNMVPGQMKRAKTYVLIHKKHEEQTLKALSDQGEKMAVTKPQMLMEKSSDKKIQYHTCSIVQKRTTQKQHHDGFGQVLMQSAYTKDMVKYNLGVQQISEASPQIKPKTQHVQSTETKDGSQVSKDSMHAVIYLQLQTQDKEEKLTALKMLPALPAKSCNARNKQMEEDRFWQTGNNISLMNAANKVERKKYMIFQAHQLRNTDIKKKLNICNLVFAQSNIDEERQRIPIQKSWRAIPPVMQIQKDQQQLKMPVRSSQVLMQTGEQPKFSNVPNQNSKLMMHTSLGVSQPVKQKLLDKPYAFDLSTINTSKRKKLNRLLETDQQMMLRRYYFNDELNEELQHKHRANIHKLNLPLSIAQNNKQVAESENQTLRVGQLQACTNYERYKSKWTSNNKKSLMIHINKKELSSEKTLTTVHTTENTNSLIQAPRIELDKVIKLTAQQSTFNSTFSSPHTDKKQRVEISNLLPDIIPGMKTQNHFSTTKQLLDMDKHSNTPLKKALTVKQTSGMTAKSSQTKPLVLDTKQCLITYNLDQGQTTFMKDITKDVQILETNSNNHTIKTDQFRPQHSIEPDEDKYLQKLMKMERKMLEIARSAQNSIQEIRLLKRRCWLKKQQKMVKRHIVEEWKKRDLSSTQRLSTITSNDQATSKTLDKDQLSLPNMIHVVNKPRREVCPALHQEVCLSYISIIHYPCNVCGALLKDPLSMAFHSATHNQVHLWHAVSE